MSEPAIAEPSVHDGDRNTQTRIVLMIVRGAVSGARAPGSGGERHRPVIIAMVAVRVMQMPVDQVIGVVPVRHPLMAAPRPVVVARFMPGARVPGGAVGGIALVDGDHVFVDVALVRVVQMPVVEVVDVVTVLKGGVPARGAMDVAVTVVGVMRVVSHGTSVAPTRRPPEHMRMRSAPTCGGPCASPGGVAGEVRGPSAAAGSLLRGLERVEGALHLLG